MFWDNILQFKSCLKISLKIFLNEIPVRLRHVVALRYNWKKIRQYIFLMPGTMCVENTRNLLYFLVQKYYDFRARNNHCGNIAHKVGTPATSLLHCMINRIKIWNSMELNVRKNLTWLLIFLFWLAMHSLQQHESEIIFAFPFLTSGYGHFGRLLFRVGRTQESSVFSK